MEKVHSHLEAIKEKLGRSLNAEVEEQAGKIIVKKKRAIEIIAETRRFACMVEHDISFENISQNGIAHNKAEIYLLPEEYTIFCLTLSEHAIPFPAHYQQWQRTNPQIISICMESLEPAEHFAERLSAALNTLE